MAVCSSPKVTNDEFANLGVFLPYTQKGDNQKGLGLGLSISRKGIEAHGGHVRVRDIPGKGCVFSVEVKRYASNVSATPFPVIRELQPIASS